MVEKRTPPEHTPPGHPEHPEHPEADDRPEHERADDGDSETLALLRVRVHEDYARRQQYGPLGRSL
ncbi:hypothetical protein [Streptomyces sp. bgisy084]|uniref:hypothetical protein n=1 Tax=Streptomyces sp. bgisy084 TaxID=3413777 RepID=UPI003D70DB4B